MWMLDAMTIPWLTAPVAYAVAACCVAVGVAVCAWEAVAAWRERQDPQPTVVRGVGAPTRPAARRVVG